jgi:hypothetical protein
MGSYGKREYIPGQEKIRVGACGGRGDLPMVGWRMMTLREETRRGNF